MLVKSKGIPREKWLNNSGLGIIVKILPSNVPLASKRKCMTLAGGGREVGSLWKSPVGSCFFPQIVDAVIVFS